jgi:hypothetical protein
MMSALMMSATLMFFTVNPDGSFKAQVEITIPSLPAEMQGPGGEPRAEAEAQGLVRQFVGMAGAPSEMADAWSDVSLTKTADGSWKFKGTAYGKDITATYLLPWNDRKDITTWKKDLPAGQAGDKGGMVFVTNMRGDKHGPRALPPTDAEMAQRIVRVRARLAGKEGQAMEKMMPRMRMEFAFRLPGKVAEVEGFAKGEDGAVRKIIDGTKVLADLKALMADEAQLKASIIADGDPMDSVMLKHVGGIHKARVTGDLKPQFDYAAEVKAAKEAFPKMMEKLALPPAPSDSR